MRTPSEQFAALFPRRAPALLGFAFLLLACPPAPATVYDAGTPITEVSITNPADNEVWLRGTAHTLTCTTSTDTDLACDGAGWYPVNDTVTHYWTGPGTFKYNDCVGTSVIYICPDAAGTNIIIVYADDNYAFTPVDAAVVDESPAWDLETVSVVSLEVYQLGWGNDHPLYRTPIGVGDFYGWGDGVTPITDVVWHADSNPTVNAATNHGCFTKGAANAQLINVRCRTPVPLTEGSSFWLCALGPNTWNSAYFTISTGNRESSTGSLSLYNQTLATTVKRYAGNYNCSWYYICTTGSNQWRPINTTWHSVYLTFGTPSPGGVASTVQRIDAVCGWANTKAAAKAVADGVHTGMPKIRFGHTEPLVDDWRLLIPRQNEVPGVTDPDDRTATFRGECDEYARFMDRSLDMLGLTGSEPYLTFASTDDSVRSPESIVHTDGYRYWLKFDFDTNGTIDNNFEGTLQVPLGGGTYHYYAVVPTLSAATEKDLLRQIGPDNYGAVQRWIRADNNGTDMDAFYTAWPPDPQLPGTEPYPN